MIYTGIIDLFGKQVSISKVNTCSYTGRETESKDKQFGNTRYEFVISVHAKSYYDARKQILSVLNNSQWIKKQNLKSLRLNNVVY